MDHAPLPELHAQPGRIPAPELARCPNCQTPVRGRFCSECGQRQVERLVSLRRMVVEVLEDQFSLNAALPRTLFLLLLRPGLLTRDYIAGRIARYIPPFRLYLLSSVLFFLVISLATHFPRFMEEAMNEAREEAAAERVADAVAGAARVAATPDAETDPAGASLPPASAADPASRPEADAGAEPGGRAGRRPTINIVSSDTASVPRWLRPLAIRAQEQEQRLNAMNTRELFALFGRGLRENAPAAVFLLVPVFAFFLKGLYIRRRRLYVEHFVFALHVHAFAFLLFTLVLLLPDWIDTALFLWFFVYLFWAMKAVYQQSVPKTAAKYLSLLLLYNVAFALVIAAAVVVTLFTV